MATISLLKSPSNQADPATESVVLLSLGSDLNGHNDTLQGGIAAVFLDRFAGVLFGLNDPTVTSVRVYTAYLNVTYRKPIRTPQVVIGKANIHHMEGRKLNIHVEMQDKDGTVLCEAKALFVKARENL